MSTSSTKLLTGQEAASILLRRLRVLGLKVGDAVPMSQIRARWQRTIYSFTELDVGIDHLLINKHLELRRDDTDILYLTEAGFEALRNARLQSADSRTPHQNRRHPHTPGQRPLLLVEDDDAFRDALEEELLGAGYDVVTAEDGQEALDFLETGALPSLILLDLMMPRVNGWDVLNTLKADPRFVSIPVILMTAFPERAPTGTRLFSKPLQLDALLAFLAEKSGLRP